MKRHALLILFALLLTTVFAEVRGTMRTVETAEQQGVADDLSEQARRQKAVREGRKGRPAKDSLTEQSAPSSDLERIETDTTTPLWLFTEGVKRAAIHHDTTAARDYFERTINADTSFAPAYFQLFLNNLYATPDEGVALAQKAWQIDTTNHWYLRFYGQSLIYARRYKEALHAYERLIRMEPDDPDNYRILAVLYEEDNNPYIALSTLDSAELRCGRIPYLSMMKRRLLIATNQIDKAITEQEALVADDPYTVQYHADLGDLYGIGGRDSLAISEFEHALRMDPDRVATYLTLAAFHNDRRDFRAFLATFKRMFQRKEIDMETKLDHIERLTSDVRFYGNYYLEISDLMNTLAIMYPQEKRVVELYAQHLMAVGEMETALNLFKAHLDDKPLQKDYYLTVIDIENYLQHTDSAKAYVDRAMHLFPKDLDLHLTKGLVHIRAREYDAALATYRGALRLTQQDSVRSAIWCSIGDTYHEMAQHAGGLDEKMMRQCYKAYERSLALDGDNIMVLNNYAYFLSLQNRELDRALALAAHVIAREPKNATYLDTYAWVLYQMGRYEEAKQAMRQAIAMDSRQSPALMVHYGDILFKLKEYFLAENYWRKALEGGFDAQEIEERITELKTQKEQPHD